MFLWLKWNLIVYGQHGNQPLAQLLGAHAIGAGGLGFKSRVGQISTESPTARHRCDVSPELELCSPGAKPQRRAPPLVTASMIRI